MLPIQILGCILEDANLFKTFQEHFRRYTNGVEPSLRLEHCKVTLQEKTWKKQCRPCNNEKKSVDVYGNCVETKILVSHFHRGTNIRWTIQNNLSSKPRNWTVQLAEFNVHFMGLRVFCGALHQVRTAVSKYFVLFCLMQFFSSSTC